MRGSDAVAWRVICALPWTLRNRAGMRAVGDRHRRNQTHASTPLDCAQHKIHAGDGTAPDAKARIMRAFLWAALGKGCIRMRQDRAESEVIQETLFGFFSEKGGLKCYGGRRENCNKAF